MLMISYFKRQNTYISLQVNIPVFGSAPPPQFFLSPPLQYLEDHNSLPVLKCQEENDLIKLYHQSDNDTRLHEALGFEMERLEKQCLNYNFIVYNEPFIHIT